MGFGLKKGSNFALCPAGTHVARCYIVLDMGMQPREYMGKKKDSLQMIRIGFELPFEKHVFNEEKGAEPFTLSRRFSNTLADKGKLRPMLNSWRGKPLTEEDIKAFSFAKLLGAPALITVVHEPKKGTTDMVAKIDSIAKLPPTIAGQKVECPPAILPPIIYSIDQGPDHPDFKKLPEWMREECAQCEEWSNAPEDTGTPGAPPQAGDATPDDNSPF